SRSRWSRSGSSSKVCPRPWISRTAWRSSKRAGRAMDAEEFVRIEHELDIVTARQKGRELAARAGFERTEQTLIATAISEIARNIVAYARRGEMVLKTVSASGRSG